MECHVRASCTFKPEAENASDCLQECHLRHAASIHLGFSEGIGQTHDEVGQQFLEELTGRIYYEPSKAWSDNLKGS
jgi:hypothetical protein